MQEEYLDLNLWKKIKLRTMILFLYLQMNK